MHTRWNSYELTRWNGSAEREATVCSSRGIHFWPNALHTVYSSNGRNAKKIQKPHEKVAKWGKSGAIRARQRRHATIQNSAGPRHASRPPILRCVSLARACSVFGIYSSLLADVYTARTIFFVPIIPNLLRLTKFLSRLKPIFRRQFCSARSALRDWGDWVSIRKRRCVGV